MSVTEAPVSTKYPDVRNYIDGLFLVGGAIVEGGLDVVLIWIVATFISILVHELGHACGLPHSGAADNLMLPKRMGDRLAPWQAAVLRSSRHVTYR